MISGFLFKPPAKFAGKRPVIIDIHGGPEGQARPWFQGEQNYFVNELGVAMIQPNVRGSTGYGKHFFNSITAFCAKAPTRTLARCWIGSRRALIWMLTGSW
jgi:dipeptidyl aminopeptidase/acylaminoacyl peptidase